MPQLSAHLCRRCRVSTLTVVKVRLEIAKLPATGVKIRYPALSPETLNRLLTTSSMMSDCLLPSEIWRSILSPAREMYRRFR